MLIRRIFEDVHKNDDDDVDDDDDDEDDNDDDDDDDDDENHEHFGKLNCLQHGHPWASRSSNSTQIDLPGQKMNLEISKNMIL
eukprot:3879442-Karenia_brevis.AAC.1